MDVTDEKRLYIAENRRVAMSFVNDVHHLDMMYVVMASLSPQVRASLSASRASDFGENWHADVHLVANVSITFDL
eukprot:6492807-Amphidinium_carterae.7